MGTLEFGLDTFLPVTVDQTGEPISGDQAFRNSLSFSVGGGVRCAQETRVGGG
jgi:hypothetical protein